MRVKSNQQRLLEAIAKIDKRESKRDDNEEHDKSAEQKAHTTQQGGSIHVRETPAITKVKVDKKASKKPLIDTSRLLSRYEFN